MGGRKKAKAKCRKMGPKQFFFGDPRIDMTKDSLWLSDHGMLRRQMSAVATETGEENDGSEPVPVTLVSYISAIDVDGSWKQSESGSLEELARLDEEAGRMPMKFMGYLEAK